MPFRSTDTLGNTAIPVNAAIVGYRLVPAMPVADAVEVYSFAEQQNEYAAAVRRHPSWSPKFERDLRFQADHEWTTEQIRNARIILTRALRAFGDPAAPQLTRKRADGRYEVADHEDANGLYCKADEWCILEAGHPGDCNEDRESWFGADTLYPPRELTTA